MKIKLAILEADAQYLNKMRLFFTANYAEKVEIYSFTQEEVALQSLKAIQADVFWAGTQFALEQLDANYQGQFAYLVDDLQTMEFNGKPTVCKYQKAELLYKVMLRMFTEKIPDSVKIKFDGVESVKVLSFASAAGGMGSSTLAVAFAMNAAARGKRCLYLNLEQFGNTEGMLTAQGQYTFSDAIFAIKTQKANLMLKLESLIEKDVSGVSFFKSPTTALDSNELSPDDLATLIGECRASAVYDYVVLDIDFQLDAKTHKAMELSNEVILVSNGTPIANDKLIRAVQAFKLQDSQKNTMLHSKLKLMYNLFGSKHGQVVDGNLIETLGGIPIIANATSKDVLNIIKDNRIFEKLL